MGSHFNYRQRTPKRYRLFTKTSYSRSELTEYQLEYLSYYDNSIHYTDSIISTIIEEIDKQSKSSVLIYFSDHSEAVFETDNIDYHGHSMDLKYAHVPMLMWCSDEYKRQNQEIIQNIKQATELPTTTENLIHSFVNLCGADVNLYNAEYDFLSSEYKTMTPRYYCDKEYKGETLR